MANWDDDQNSENVSKKNDPVSVADQIRLSSLERGVEGPVVELNI